jgi:hypothetical protein
MLQNVLATHLLLFILLDMFYKDLESKFGELSWTYKSQEERNKSITNNNVYVHLTAKFNNTIPCTIKNLLQKNFKIRPPKYKLYAVVFD